ncbi:UPF0481 protein At3g47200-like [Pistacia vera]|uniref:UPF0481 protein At3g47200-like n=1 Tax=Pistacia vera TaxID=55513 RepID=UPI0012631805|nr:UPF0481 protein At3g47200-like [Pistacia vera]
MADNSASGDAVERREIAIYRDVEIAECCIHKVPENLRKVNPGAYSPQLISIGPYHLGEQVLAAMENHKKRYVDAFFHGLTLDQLEKFRNYIVTKQTKICYQYAEPIQLSPDVFLPMVLRDAIFIIELFLRVRFEHQGDFLLNEVWLGTIRRDLLLLENQLPYFVLEDLYNLAGQKASGNQIPIINLAGRFFQLNRSHNRPLSSQRQDVKINHFTDLYRFSLVEIPETPRFSLPMTTADALPNVVKLKKSGVKPRWGKYLVEVKFNDRKTPLFNVVELEIPRFEITENTECVIRNLMALEQCHYPSETYICSYIHLLTFLIKTEKDVDYFKFIVQQC